MCTFATWKKNRVFLVVLLLVFGSAALVVPLGFRCSYLVQYLIQCATRTRKQHRQQDEAKAAQIALFLDVLKLCSNTPQKW